MIEIDHLKPILIDENICGNEISTLSYLSVGLYHLYFTVKNYETMVENQNRASGTKIILSMGSTRGLPHGADQFLPCLFHWFGVSIMNYARLIGFLDGISTGKYTKRDLENHKNYEKVKKASIKYADSVPELKNIKKWRNKVAAHFAITDPNENKDNPAFLEFSIMYPVSYCEGRFKVGRMEFTRTDSTGAKHKASLPTWSLTEVYEALQIRYWPQQPVS